MRCSEEKGIQFNEEFGIDHIVCCYSDRGIQQLAGSLACRAELAHYELLKETYDDLTWEEYLYFLCKSEKMREQARCVVLKAQRDFDAARFDFKTPQEEKDGGQIRIVRLFEGWRAKAFVILFLFKAELVHYHMVRMARGERYTLSAYMQDLQTDAELAEELRAGFEVGVRRLDFRKAWIQEGYDFPEDWIEE